MFTTHDSSLSFKTQLTWYLSFLRSYFFGFVSRPWLNTVFKGKIYKSLKPLNSLQFLLVDSKNRTNLKVAELVRLPGITETALISHHLSVVVAVHVSPHIPLLIPQHQLDYTKLELIMYNFTLGLGLRTGSRPGKAELHVLIVINIVRKYIYIYVYQC